MEVLEVAFKDQMRINEMTGKREILSNVDGWQPMKDCDESALRLYFQVQFGMYNSAILNDALNVHFEKHRFNPLTDILDKLKWDGTDRIKDFLHFALGADDTSYIQECSRLIFAGAVHRAYEPGCKFDDMIVLVGNQGGGKSSVIRWLNLRNEYFTELKTIEGTQGIESLSGHWICEVAELMAMTNVKASEAVKAYITRQEDNYRQPYQKYTVTIPRRCIFIGTTNNDRFLNDKTGNRRFYPVEVKANGYDILANEENIKPFIEQCWAEAVYKYQNGDEYMQPFARRELIPDIREAQENAMEDDWRTGAVREYLDTKKSGDVTCVLEVWNAITADDDHRTKPQRADSIEISKIIISTPGWKKIGARKIDGCGQQKAYRLERMTVIENDDDCPF